MESLIASLPAFPAPTSPSPEPAPASPKESAADSSSGFARSQTIAVRESCAWKMLQASLLPQLPLWTKPSGSSSSEPPPASWGNWPIAGGLRNGCIFERPPWEPRISASAGFYSPGANPWAHWDTPDTNPEAANLGSNRVSQPAGLGNQAKARTDLWLTPNCPNGGRCVPPEIVASKGSTEDGKRTVGLESQSRFWTTPQAHDVSERGSGQQPTAHAGNACLARDARQWPTPDCNTASYSNGLFGMNLREAAACWPTVSNRDGDPRRSPSKPDSAHIRHKIARGAVNAAGLPSDDLSSAVQMWPTPSAAVVNDGESAESWEARRLRNLEKRNNGNGMGTPLTIAAQTWPTPRANERQQHNSQDNGVALSLSVQTWPTPSANNQTGTGVRGERTLNLQTAADLWPTPYGFQAGNGPDGNEFSTAVRNWATPRSTDGEKGGPNQRGSRGDPILPGQAASWATPMARIAKGGGNVKHRPDGKTRLDMLDWQAEAFSPPDLPTQDGPTSSPDAPGSPPPSPLTASVSGGTRPDLSERKRLNPMFTEWLMGWPAWWTSTEPTACGFAEMESFRFRLRVHLLSLCGEP